MVSAFARLLGMTVAVLVMISGTFVTSRNSTASSFPDLIPLPAGWQPEGIVVGKGSVIYSGSRANGSIYAADLRTGEGEVIVESEEGRSAVGLSFDDRTNHLFVAGGGAGLGFVYDTQTGELVAEYNLAACEDDDGNLLTFVNDVVVTREAAYFTDSFCPVLYRVPLGPGGRMPDQSEIETIDLAGNYEHVDGAFNVNGIDATADGSQLIIVQSATGLLFEVDPGTGEAMEIDLGGDLMNNGDGILLHGKILYVVQNRIEQVSEIALTPDLQSGEVVDVHTSAEFDIPTTIAKHGSRLYVVNARFGVMNPGSAAYDIVRLPD